MTLSDSSQNILEDLKRKIESTYKKNTEHISNEIIEAIQKCEELKETSKNDYESHYKRKKIIDYLIYANLGITPILFIILSYVLFFKK
jgi:uncharacterized protein YgiM (DUF1202 family)